jgi:glycosyltransferase involved in cell wall biosynthesis
METTIEHWDRDAFDLVLTTPLDNFFYERIGERVPSRLFRVRHPYIEPQDCSERTWDADIASCLQLLQEEKPDVVFLSGVIPGLAMAARMSGIPTICYVHTSLLDRPPAVVASTLHRFVLPLCDKIMTPMNWYRDRLRALYNAPENRVGSVRLGSPLAHVDPEDFDRDETRARFELPQDRPIVFISGSLLPVKRPEVAIKAFAEAVRLLPDAYLLLAGDDVGSGNSKMVADMVQELGIQDNVRFLGYVRDPKDMAALYVATDVLLHCALVDTGPLSVLESMTLGLPVCAMNVQGPGEYIVNGETGRAVPPESSPEEIGRSLAELLQNTELRAKMSKASRARVMEHFTPQRNAREFQDLCRELLGMPSKS